MSVKIRDIRRSMNMMTSSIKLRNITQKVLIKTNTGSRIIKVRIVSRCPRVLMSLKIGRRCEERKRRRMKMRRRRSLLIRIKTRKRSRRSTKKDRKSNTETTNIKSTIKSIMIMRLLAKSIRRKSLLMIWTKMMIKMMNTRKRINTKKKMALAINLKSISISITKEMKEIHPSTLL